MRYVSLYVNGGSNVITVFSNIYHSFEQAKKEFNIPKSKKDNKQVTSTDASIEIYMYGGLYLYIVREDNPLFPFAALDINLNQMIWSKKREAISSYVQKRFISYQLWMREHLAKQKR